MRRKSRPSFNVCTSTPRRTNADTAQCLCFSSFESTNAGRGSRTTRNAKQPRGPLASLAAQVRMQPKAITLARAATATVKEKMSPGLNPKSWLEIAREASYDKGSPSSNPPPSNKPVSRRIMARMSRPAAPRAMRTPISFVRHATPCAVTP